MKTTRSAGLSGRGRRGLVGAAVALTVALALAGCGSSSGNDADSGAARVVTVAQPTAMSSVAWTLVQAGGFFEKHRIKLEALDIKSGPEAVAAVASGSADVGFGPLPPTAAILQQSDSHLVIPTTWRLADALVLAGKPDRVSAGFAKDFPANVRELSGSKIGVAALGGVAHDATLTLLKQAGVSADDVTFIAVGAGAAMAASVKQDQVDFAISNIGIVEQFRGAGVDVTSAVDFSNPDQVGDEIASAILATDIMNTAFLKKKPELAADYCTAMREGLEWAKDPANLDTVAASIAKFIGISDDAAKALWTNAERAYGTDLNEAMWTSQPLWAFGGTVPPFDSSVHVCGQS